ncbi:DUF7379 domain-containing protein [Ferruginibacter profundus]
MKIKNIAIKGEKQPVPVASITPNLVPVASYIISGANRDVQQTHVIDVKDNDKLFEFVFDDGTTWMCDPATLHELFPEVEMAYNRSADNAFELPVNISNANSDRGILGSLALKLLNVFTKKKIAGGIGEIAGRLEDKLMIDGEGLFRLEKDFKLSGFENKTPDKPFLLFIHGTNSNTIGAFGQLKNADVWDFIYSRYDKNVLAFQHRTLSKSPLQNVLDMVKQLPDSADLHIISHSRGGIVGDILCRYAINSDGSKIGFADDNIKLLKAEGRQQDIDCIKALDKAFLNKKIKVKKFIRVACPAAGTKLASKRLDTIMNAFFNLFGGPLNPVADIIKELIAETIRTKDNVNVLPGVEAQSPDSPFIKILNDRADDVAIDGSSLAVISGNGKISLSVSGLLVILGKLFYSQRNDLVVNTDSMYLGANRKGKIQYFFDQGEEVNHVKYFFNNKTRQAIALALKTGDGELIPGYTIVSQYEVPASDRGIFGLEHGELYPYKDLSLGKRPIVVLLPGIMGSNLSNKKNKIWIAYLRAVFGGLMDLQHVDDKSITATSLIKTSYGQLANRLQQTYDVIIYPFDWRKQLNDCAKEFNDKIIELLKYEQPIKIIGHSMGGVLVRDFIINYDATWQRLNASSGFKLLFLGSPLGGSFRIPTVLFGNDAIINSLNMLDRKHTKKELLTMFSAFPGILSLLPLTTEAGYDFAETDTWKKMADANGDSTWPIPDKDNLKVFKDYRNNIIAKRDAIDYSNMIYIAGKDKSTPCDYYNDIIPPRTELVFLYTGEGDQSVTWESGIPKQLIANNTVYYVNVTHGALANEPSIFEGIEQLLEKGSTGMLSKIRPVVRGEEQKFRMPELYNFDFSERGISNAVFGITEKNEPAVNQVPISVSVSNGDLAFASYPVLAGHFTNDGILYAEKSIDYNVKGSLYARHHMGIYPGDIGTNTIIVTDPVENDFPGTIVVGLGEPGKLTAFLLTKTVEQGVAKYLLDINGKSGNKKEIGISALMIGCGYGGLSIENSVKAVLEGVNNANNKVIQCLETDAKIVQSVEFIELYEDKALGCLYALGKIERKENRIYNISIVNRKIKGLFGLRKRLPVNSSDEWWNRLTVKRKISNEGAPGKEVAVTSLLFNASTSDAREEEKELFSTGLIDPFIEQVSSKNQWTAEAAKTLFELMIPNEFKESLKKKGSICWVLDKYTAGYPWELLQENVNETKPLCIGAGMIRQLATTAYRTNIKRGATEMALVVADPLLNGFIDQLPGAKAEGVLVDSLLTTNGYPKVSLINKTAPEIVLQLFSNDFKIIHLAGHGVYNPLVRQKSGMVIGEGVFLTTADIEQMGTVPELVFVNCCHLGKVDSNGEEYFKDRYKLAANIGTQLIEIGVKVVIAAGWAVDDAAASDFANIFYTRIFEGYNFGDAVSAARTFVYENHPANNTWGAYQCYGDPFYKLINRSVAKKEYMPNYIIEEEAEIDLNNLRNDLDTRNITSLQAAERLKSISEAVTAAEIEGGAIFEQQALIYYELGEYDEAAKKYAALLRLEKASYSVSALEKYFNSLAKQCMLDFKQGKNKTTLANSIDSTIRQLKKLLEVGKTAERFSLIGSAYRRKAMISIRRTEKLAAYKAAVDFYNKALEVNRYPYPLNNWLVLQIILDLTQKDAKQMVLTPAIKAATKKEINALKAKVVLTNGNMDYWTAINDICFDFSLIMLDLDAHRGADSKKNNLYKDDKTWTGLANSYKHIWKRYGSKGKKLAEIENFEIIADALSLSTSKIAIDLKDRVDTLKKELEQLSLE